MVPPAESLDTPGTFEVSERAIDDALNGVLATSLRPVCVGLALFYALLTGWYLTQLQGNAQLSMSGSTALLSLGLLAGAVWFERNRLPSWLAHPAAALIGSAVILNCLFTLVSVPEARQTTNLMIAQLGFGCLLLSVRWFLGLSLIALLGWAWVAGARTEDPDWYHFGLALFEATLFGALILVVRIRAYRNIQKLHLRDQRLMSDLREANDAARVAVKAKSEFLANMSHEIRTPMTAMLGMAELLQMTELSHEQLEYASTIERSGNTLLQLVNDILDFSKVEAGQLMLEQVSFKLHDLLDEVSEVLAVKARQKSLMLSVEAQGLEDAYFRGDPTRIKQVLFNLVGNALKFTHDGGVLIRAHAKAVEDGRWLVEIGVEDTGIGIDASQQEHVFEAFTQADASTTRKYGGTGLGLAISTRLARLMGGEIKLRSELGRGSAFTMALLLPGVERRSSVPVKASLRPLRYEGRVLLVEDNADTRSIAREMLRRMGCDVELVGDGLEALERLSLESYDLVLMDCHMPNMNGFDATREIRKREADCGRRTTIVALTASVLPEDRALCIEVGMDDYVAKPFSRRDLETVLERWL
ncbi:MAG TPA: ATP-binding protein [Polyangiales bacterium]|nr:ATP-binding protein [Polyangiales bacterium]